MSVPLRYAIHQGPVLKGMGQAIFSAFKQRAGWAAPPATIPGPIHRITVAARPQNLVQAYVKHVGGEVAGYRGHVPAHLFPQWSFGLTGKVMEGLKYPMLAAMNGGCKLTINAPLPADEPFEVTGQLVGVDDNGQRAIIDQKLVTATRNHPEAVVAHLYVFIPLKNGEKKKSSSEKPRVSPDAREIAYWILSANAGLDFAKLTGDFNPVHWVPRWARAFGFKNVILHGFGTLARACEGLIRGKFAGQAEALREIDVRFTRPLTLPARVGLYVLDDKIWVGDAPGGPAYLEGTFKGALR